jgi:hypothetical protein
MKRVFAVIAVLVVSITTTLSSAVQPVYADIVEVICNDGTPRSAEGTYYLNDGMAEYYLTNEQKQGLCENYCGYGANVPDGCVERRDNADYCDKTYPITSADGSRYANKKCKDFQPVDGKNNTGFLWISYCDWNSSGGEGIYGTLSERDICEDAQAHEVITRYTKPDTTTPTPPTTASQNTTAAPYPPANIANELSDLQGWKAGTGSFRESDSITFAALTDWQGELRAIAGDWLHFAVNEPSYFDPNGKTWVEGKIGDMTSVERQQNNGLVVEIDWAGYGYYKNLDFCANKYITDEMTQLNYNGFWGDTPAGLAKYTFGEMLSIAEHLETDGGDVSKSKDDLKACIYGQVAGMKVADYDTRGLGVEISGITEIDSLTNINVSETEFNAISSLEACSSLFWASGGSTSGIINFNNACGQGFSNKPEKDTYFIRIGDVRDSGPTPCQENCTGTLGGAGTGGASGTNTNTSGTDETETDQNQELAQPAPIPEDPQDLLDPCTIEAIASGSEFYTANDPAAVDDNQTAPRAPIKQVIWNALISPTNNLTPEQVAAIMANIQGISNYNPASIAALLAPPLEDQQEIPEETLNSIDITGVGLIHWNNLELTALMNNLIEDGLFEPFFESDSVTVYNGGSDEITGGDKFFELADADEYKNKYGKTTSKMADELLNMEIRKIIGNIDGTGFRDSVETIENAVNFFYNHLVLTDGTTPAPEEWIEFAQAILDEFKDAEVVEEEPTEEPEPDPSCVDGFKRNPAAATVELLNTINSVTKDRMTKSALYGSILVSQNISAQFDGRDAFAFVAAVVRASEYHTNYPVAAPADVPELDNLQSWKKVISAKMLSEIDDADLKVGDIFIESNRSSHTMIYIGEQEFNDSKPFVMANTGNSFPYYVDKTVDQLNEYNVWRRQTLPREQ